MKDKILQVQNLHVALPQEGALVPVLQGLSFSIEAGEMLALVGQSGSGKTTAAMAIQRLLPPGAMCDGSIQLEGQDLATLPERALRRVRGTRIGFVFQDPLAALNPALRVGTQIAEAMRVHLGTPRRAAWARAVSLLAAMGIENAAARAGDFPYQFSGGMRQRVLIAAALACDPCLLIADEPTSGLDPLLATQILDLIRRLQRSRGLAVLLISHDARLVARYADTVCTLDRAGPAAIALPPPLPRAMQKPWLELHNVTVRYGAVISVRNVSLTLGRGECLGIVGASGSGKTSLGRAILHMLPFEGRITLGSQSLAELRGAAARDLRRRMQVVFQEPAASLNPRMRVADIIAEALPRGGATRNAARQQAASYLQQVGLPAELLSRFPSTLSGGQAQRVAIARALAARPDLIVLDEPTASLDSETQAALLQVLHHLTMETGQGYVLISHDLRVIRALSHRIAVLHQGELVELEDAGTLLNSPRHAVSASLVAAFLCGG